MNCPKCNGKLKRRKVSVLGGGRSHWVKRKYCKDCDSYWYKWHGELYKG